MIRKIERRCPRCHAHRMHDLVKTFPKGRRMRLACAECGHQWTGRALARDMDDDEWHATHRAHYQGSD